MRDPFPLTENPNICIQTNIFFLRCSPSKLVVNKANYTGLQIANNKSFDLSKYLMDDPGTVEDCVYLHRIDYEAECAMVRID